MNIPRRLFLTTLGTGVIAVATIVALLLWITMMTDRIAASEMQVRVETTLDLRIEQNGVLTEDYAYWEAAYDWYVSGDDAALYENLGSGAGESETFGFIYFLDPDGVATHAYETEVLESDLSLYLPQIGEAAFEAFGNPPLLPYGTVSGLVEVDGDIAIVSIGRIQPDAIEGLTEVDLPLMIGGRWLDATEIADALMLDTVILKPADSEVSPERTGMVLTGLDGRDIALLTWIAPQPGRILLLQVAPAVALLVVLMILASWMIGRTSARQTAAFLREKVSARTDPVTGLLNRTGLQEYVGSSAMIEKFDDGKLAVIYLDLNGLKQLNDNFGHRVGDAAIVATADRLRAAVRKSDQIARIGGDEFVCLIVDDTPQSAASAVAERISMLTRVPFSYDGQEFPADASIGISYATNAKNWDTLLSQADQAMYQAKRKKQSRAVEFTSAMAVAV